MLDENMKNQNSPTIPGEWNTRVELLVAAYPEMPAQNVELLRNLLVELVDEKGLPVPAIFFPGDNLIALEWVTCQPVKEDNVENEGNPTQNLRITDVFNVEIDEDMNYSTFAMNVFTKEAVEKDVSTHDEAVEIISGWDFTYPF